MRCSVYSHRLGVGEPADGQNHEDGSVISGSATLLYKACVCTLATGLSIWLLYGLKRSFTVTLSVYTSI